MTHEEATFKVMVWLNDHVKPAIVTFDATLNEDLIAILSNPEFERTLAKGLDEFQAGKIVPDGNDM